MPFAIAYDVDTITCRRLKVQPDGPKGLYMKIGRALTACGFKPLQKSIWVTKSDDLAKIVKAVDRLRAISKKGLLFKRIHAFEVRALSDLKRLL